MTTKTKPQEPGAIPVKTYVQLMLACNDHRGNLGGLTAVELLRRDGDPAIEFDGDIAAGENVQFVREPKHLRMIMVASGKLHNGNDGSKEFNAKLHELTFNVGNMCWNRIELELADAERFLNSLLSFRHWNVTIGPAELFETIQESQWITQTQILSAVG